MKYQGIFRSIAIIITVFILAVTFFYIVYLIDNRYTAPGAQPEGGVLELDEISLAEHPAIFLVSDWEIYRGRLLTPNDFIVNPSLPDELTCIGEFYRFQEGANYKTERSFHESVTYRLNIFLPESPHSYTLELPEIYSAYSLYINGILIKQTGTPDPNNYQPLIGISSVIPNASGQVEIVISATDYNLFYSGIVIPPAFGETETVTSHMIMRLILRVVCCTLGLCLAGFSLLIMLLIGRNGQKPGIMVLEFIYSCVCIVFTVYICHPILKFVIPVGFWTYAAKNLTWCLFLMLTMLMQKRISGFLSRWTNAFIALGIFACLWAVFVPVFFKHNVELMNTYPVLINLYTWATALYLTLCAVLSLYKGASHSRLICFALLILDAALLAEKLFPLYEPIRFGHFTELAGGVFVLCIGVTLSIVIADQIQLRHAVEARAESVAKMLEVHKTYYTALLEKEQESRAARHDLRHHIVLLREMLGRGDIESLTRYLDEYSDNQPVPLRISYCGHYVTDMLLGLYSGFAENQNTKLQIHAEVPDALPISDVDLCVILSNLLENALEASAKLPSGEREIIVRIGERRGQFIILIENVFDGILVKDSGKILSLKAQGREGVGIVSVRTVTARYNGETEFYAEENRFFSEIYVPVYREEV